MGVSKFETVNAGGQGADQQSNRRWDQVGHQWPRRSLTDFRDRCEFIFDIKTTLTRNQLLPSQDPFPALRYGLMSEKFISAARCRPIRECVHWVFISGINLQ